MKKRVEDSRLRGMRDSTWSHKECEMPHQEKKRGGGELSLVPVSAF